MAKEDIIKAAESYIGTPFHHQGRLPGVGLDCIGLVLCAYWEAGYKPPEANSGYTRIPKPQTMRRELLRDSYQIDVNSKWEIADVIWFRIKNQPQHLALWTGKEIIHAYEPSGKVTKQPLDSLWFNSIECVLRYRGFNV